MKIICEITDVNIYPYPKAEKGECLSMTVLEDGTALITTAEAKMSESQLMQFHNAFCSLYLNEVSYEQFTY